jgi:hypothetical protein
MSVLENIVEELKALPPRRLEEAADYIRRLKELNETERRQALDRAYGCLSEEEANAMEQAIQANCERIDASQW